MNCQSALQAAAYNVQLIGNAPERCIPMKICYIQGPGMVVIILMGLGMTFSCVPVYFNHWLVVMNCMYSERSDAAGTSGQRLKEGGSINKSLVTLGSVISTLGIVYWSCHFCSKVSYHYCSCVFNWFFPELLHIGLDPWKSLNWSRYFMGQIHLLSHK